MSQILFLKPQALGLQDRNYSLTDAYRVVKQEIDHGNDWNKWKENKLRPNPFVKTYLHYLLDAAAGKTVNKNHIADVVSGIDTDDIHQIHNDFGEIIGPMNILTKPKVLFPTLKLDRNDKIYWPVRSNEPLLDFKIFKGDVDYKFSSKTGTATNTIKPNDIVGLIQSKPKLMKKWGNTPEFAVMKTLIEQSMWVGPYYALLVYNSKAIRKIPLNKKDLEDKIALARSQPVLSMKPKMKAKVISNLIEAEHKLVELSKTSLNYTDMFYEAISGTIFYINWIKTDSNQLPVFHTSGEKVVAKDEHRKRVVLRSKNSPAHARDKLGLQM